MKDITLTKSQQNIMEHMLNGARVCYMRGGKIQASFASIGKATIKSLGKSKMIYKDTSSKSYKLTIAGEKFAHAISFLNA